eukprot:5721879-Heterocapsa_arctica.AAC.1
MTRHKSNILNEKDTHTYTEKENDETTRGRIRGNEEQDNNIMTNSNEDIYNTHEKRENIHRRRRAREAAEHYFILRQGKQQKAILY